MGKYVSDAPITDILVSPLGEVVEDYFPKISRNNIKRKRTYFSTSSTYSYVSELIADASYIYTSDRNAFLRKYSADTLAMMVEKSEIAKCIGENSKGIYYIPSNNASVKRARKSDLVTDVLGQAIAYTIVDLIVDEDFVYAITDTYVYKLNPDTLAIVSTSGGLSGACKASNIDANYFALAIYIASTVSLKKIAKNTLAIAASVPDKSMSGVPSFFTCNSDGNFCIGRGDSSTVFIGNMLEQLGDSVLGTIFEPTLDGVSYAAQGFVSTGVIFGNYVIVLRSGNTSSNYKKFLNVFDMTSGSLLDDFTTKGINYEAASVGFSNVSLSKDKKHVFFELGHGSGTYSRWMYKIPICFSFDYKIK